MKTTFIYELIDPITDETRYIGKANNPKGRFAGHLNDKSKAYKNNWIKSLKNKGLKPILNIIDEVNNEEAGYWEIFYISLYRSWNCRLTNLDKGGLGGSRMSVETKKKMSLVHKGKKLSLETRERLSKVHKGKHHSKETKEKYQKQIKAKSVPKK